MAVELAFGGLEVSTLCDGVKRIVELVRRQQSLAGSKGVFEKSSVAEQVEAAVHICQQASASAEAHDRAA